MGDCIQLSRSSQASVKQLKASDAVAMSVEPRVALPSDLRLVTCASWQSPRTSKELVFSSTGSFWVDRRK